MDQVARLIAYEEVKASSALAERTNQPELIIKAILDLFQDKGFITLSKALRPETIISIVNPRLGHVLSSNT